MKNAQITKKYNDEIKAERPQVKAANSHDPSEWKAGNRLLFSR